jgi:hypothetical protein
MRNFLIATALSGLTLGCGEPVTQSANVDMVFKGGPIYTAVDAKPTVEAVAVDDGRIVYAGTAAGLSAWAGADTQVVDLKGSAMYPGFTDAHGHLIGIGFREVQLNLEGIPSLAAMVEKVAERVKTMEKGELLYGRGWIETHWPEGRFPTVADIDAVSPDNPVMLRRTDGHALVANSMAIKAAGITRDSVAPMGGDILKDDDGELTGMFIDTAMGAFGKLTTAPTMAERDNAFVLAGKVYTAYGWTGIHSMSVNPSDVSLMEKISDEGRLGLRVYNSIDGLGQAAYDLFKNGPSYSDNKQITTRAIKLYMDGALGSRGAALLEKYSDADHMGLMRVKMEEYSPILEAALRAGIQVNTHAIGDKGNRELLNWYEAAYKAVPKEEWASTDLRWRDEHTQVVNPEDIPRFKELGVIPSMQPSHAINDLFYAPDRLGKDRLHGAYAWRSLIDSGVIIAGGSDAPVERGDPRIEYYGAVARKSIVDGFSNEDWHPEEAVTRQEALKMFTAWPAYASFMENDLGTIEVGKLADFTVYDKDIMTIPEREILTVNTVLTIVEGKVVYSGADDKK